MNDNFLEISGIHGKNILSEAAFPILKGLSPLNMRILNSACRVMHVSKDVEMMHEGDTPHDLYFIKQGSVAIGRQVGTQLKVIRRLKSGDVYGEFGVLRRKSRYASVYTSEASTIIRVTLSAIQQLLKADNDFKKRVETLLSMRLLDSFFFSHPVFHALPEHERKQLASTLPIQFHDRNARIFGQGGKPQGIYLILSGEVEVRHTNRSGEECLLEIRRDNDLIGEVANKNGQELAYSAVAASDVDILMLDQKNMKAIHNWHPETFKSLERHINKRAERTVIRLRKNME